MYLLSGDVGTGKHRNTFTNGIIQASTCISYYVILPIVLGIQDMGKVSVPSPFFSRLPHSTHWVVLWSHESGVFAIHDIRCSVCVAPEGNGRSSALSMGAGSSSLCLFFHVYED